MTSISTLSEFLLQSGCQYRVYDLGRAIRKLDPQTFLDIENNRKAHPYPRLGYAWLAVLFWNKQLSHQQYIWFLKLPLDEQGMLVSAARNHFLGIVLEALGKQMDNASPDTLPEHPYGFVPGQQQMADFNALVRKAMKLPESEHLANVQAYIRAPADLEWQSLALQGLADLAASLDAPKTRQLFISQFTALHQQVQLTLLNSLENHQLDVGLSEFILAQMAAHPTQPAWQIAGLRALSQSQADGLVADTLSKLLQGEQIDSDLLITISGRHWHRLLPHDLLSPYINLVAEHTPDLFAPVFADLVRLPQLRTAMLAMLRSTNKSPVLTQAIGRLFSEQQQ